MIEVQMLIPVTANGGATFSGAHHMVFEAEILTAFGGYTLLLSGALGGWRNADGVTYADATRLYVIAIASIVDGAKLGTLAAFAKAHYTQEAIAIRYLGIFEIL